MGPLRTARCDLSPGEVELCAIHMSSSDWRELRLLDVPISLLDGAQKRELLFKLRGRVIEHMHVNVDDAHAR